MFSPPPAPPKSPLSHTCFYTLDQEVLSPSFANSTPSSSNHHFTVHFSKFIRSIFHIYDITRNLFLCLTCSSSILPSISTYIVPNYNFLPYKTEENSSVSTHTTLSLLSSLLMDT